MVRFFYFFFHIRNIKTQYLTANDVKMTFLLLLLKGEGKSFSLVERSNLGSIGERDFQQQQQQRFRKTLI